MTTFDYVTQQLQQAAGMVKAFMGDQFAVSIVCRHKPGLAHLLISEDTDLAVMNCLREIQKANTGLVGLAKPPEAQPTAEPVPMADDVRAMLTLCAQVFRSYERRDLARGAPALPVSEKHKESARRNAALAEQVEALLDGKPAPQPVHPMDTLEQIAARMGLKLDPEKVAAARALCDELVPGDRITVDGQPADVVAAPTDDDASPPPLCGV